MNPDQMTQSALADRPTTVLEGDDPPAALDDGAPVRQMTFEQALTQVKLGRTVRRLAWDDTTVTVTFTEGYLMVEQANGKLDALMVTEGDLFNNDWVVVATE